MAPDSSVDHVGLTRARSDLTKDGFPLEKKLDNGTFRCKRMRSSLTDSMVDHVVAAVAMAWSDSAFTHAGRHLNKPRTHVVNIMERAGKKIMEACNRLTGILRARNDKK